MKLQWPEFFIPHTFQLHVILPGKFYYIVLNLFSRGYNPIYLNNFCRHELLLSHHELVTGKWLATQGTVKTKAGVIEPIINPTHL